MSITRSIMLNSGSPFYFLSPDASNYTIDDIAHGLSNTCRYAGQCKRFYSVAEHSVLVSQELETEKMEGLFHDAAEAFIGDVTRPLKSMLGQYAYIEDLILKDVFRRLNLNWPLTENIHIADLSVMAAEIEVLMPEGIRDWLKEVEPARVNIRCLAPEQAKQMFLCRYQELRSVTGTVDWQGVSSVIRPINWVD